MKVTKLKDLSTHWLGFAVRAANKDVKPTALVGGSHLQARGKHTKFVDKYHSFVVAATVDQLREELKVRMANLGWPVECPWHELAAARAATYGGKLYFETVQPDQEIDLEFCKGTYFGSGHYSSNYGIYGNVAITENGERDNGFCVVMYHLAKVQPGGIAVQRHNSGNRTIYYCA